MSILYYHTAYGKSGDTIIVYKLRTMTGEIDSNRSPTVSLSGLLDKTDKTRLTKFGKLARPIGIDELPQIINILVKKDMQLLGIRPFLIEEFELLPKSIQHQLHNEKPGLIPAESHYIYSAGDMQSRVAAIEAYLSDKPVGLKRIWVGMSALYQRITRYSKR